MFFTFFKLYKWYQIAQCTKNTPPMNILFLSLVGGQMWTYQEEPLFVIGPDVNLLRRTFYMIASDVNLLRRTFGMSPLARKSACQCEDGFSNKRYWYWRVNAHSMLWPEQTFKNQGTFNAKEDDLPYSKFNTLFWLLGFFSYSVYLTEGNKALLSSELLSESWIRK